MNKILYVASTLKRCGPTSQLYNIVKNLDRSCFDPIVVTLSPEPADSYWNDFKKLGIEVESLNLSRFKGTLFLKNNLQSMVKRIRPQVLHTQGIRADVLSSKMDYSLPKVATIRNFIQLDYPMTYGRSLGYLMAKQHIKALEKVDLCVGVSNAVVQNIRENTTIKNLAVIRNGVDQDLYHSRMSCEKNLFKKKLGFYGTENIWICSGHISSRKNPLELINAWKASEMGKKNTLVFLGSGELERECLDLISDCNSIQMAGRVRNVSDYLKAADYYVSSSKAEGMPNAVLEAMACGLPVLLSDIEPHQEILSLNHKIGVGYKLGSQNNLVKALHEMAIRNRNEMSMASLETVDNFLSAKAMSSQYQERYFEVVESVE
ncbi:glycosyltransferase [Halomonas sp. GXIMD04776]|uniref:glycosyltransferase n=1 Tax=Halomonas sp. GXIMD04776 TaxID=3415605 RepID=UPI003C8DE738